MISPPGTLYMHIFYSVISSTLKTQVKYIDSAARLPAFKSVLTTHNLCYAASVIQVSSFVKWGNNRNNFNDLFKKMFFNMSRDLEHSVPC